MGAAQGCNQDCKKCRDDMGMGSADNGSAITEESGNEAFKRGEVKLPKMAAAPKLESIAESPGTTDEARSPPSALRSDKRMPFEVILVREGPHWRNLGIVISTFGDAEEIPGRLIVEEIKAPSLISEWNDSQPPETRVCVGNVISCVNGNQGQSSEAMINLIKSIGEGSTVALRIE
eukprot:gnl/TRDRNA2_/TRDRNA2_93953_c0_seq1.p1 gnl/TRDRNA2_/TRDRNA2_93953_c0~~gnl/TRDRNA2_/TRDRNA2_93953_c0_seq1.p1  ORF type:complete len:176 (+),score=34.94 gnl/TRDRNA2_/TRDRNA2_93953_c0_seq1:74-601(+)